jgi:predicted GH43/DUF377 family glycosyl hydrolase
MTDWWTSEFHTTVDAYYKGDFAAGLEACERLLSAKELPDGVDLQARRNLTFYAPTLATLIPATTAWSIDIPVPNGWSRFNPSVGEGTDGLRMIVRSSNYTIARNLRYSINDDAEVVRTTNYLLDLTETLQIDAFQEINDSAFRLEPPLFPVAGFEDCRLFRHQESWWVSATARDRDPQGIAQTVLMRLECDTFAEMHVLSDAADRRHEKNWMPAPTGEVGALRFIYSSYPTVVLRYDDTAGTVAPEMISPGPLIARHFRGGTQAISIDGGRLCLVHEVVSLNNGDRVYTHRWVWFDSEWRLARLSQPFTFQDRGIEFAAGLARRGDDLVISYGIWDREAWLATVPVDQVLSLLAPPLDADDVRHEMRLRIAAAAPRSIQVSAAAQLTATAKPLDVSQIPGSHTVAEITPFPGLRPTISSVTMTGNSRDIIGDALRSVVDWVDWCLVVDTGITDDTLEIAREIAGDKLVVRSFPWRDDFAAARNFGLESATHLGADWAVMMDTDERLDLNRIDIHTALGAASADVVTVTHVSSAYDKERFFRLPARGHYAGPTHEAFMRETDWAPQPGVRFTELEKTYEQYRHKVERDVAILSRHTAQHPDDPRWFYYLGDALAGLGRDDEAIAAFRRCASLDGWDEEGAWALYRAAECFLRLERPLDAVESCAAGMTKHAGLAELPWLAAFASWQADRPAQAVYWARLAIVLGHFAGSGASVPRAGFRHQPALWEGPYDVLRFALRRLGDHAAADEAERLFVDALRAREGGQTRGVPRLD